MALMEMPYTECPAYSNVERLFMLRGAESGERGDNATSKGWQDRPTDAHMYVTVLFHGPLHQP